MPNISDVKVAGTLEVGDDGRLQLDLLGTFPLDEDAGETVREFDEPYAVVLGLTPSGEHISLGDCQQVSLGVGGGFPTTSLRPRVALIGQEHILEPFEVTFRAAHIEVDRLGHWVGFSPMPTPSGDKSTSVMYEQPDDVAVVVSEREKITLVRRPAIHWSPGETALSERVSMSFEPDDGLTWDQVLVGPIKVLQDLLTFAMDEPSGITALHVQLPIDGDTEAPGEPLLPRIFRAIYQQRIWTLEAEGERPTYPRHMLFSADSASGHSAEDLLVAWFRLHRRLDLVIDLHLAARYQAATYNELRFLLAAQSLELLHRHDFDVRPSEADSAQTQRILGALEGEDLELVRQALEGHQHASEPPLWRRFLDIFQAVPEELKAIGVPAKKRGSVATKAKDARNDLTHHDPNRPASPFSSDPESLHRLAETLRWVLNGYLLHELGYTHDEAAALIGRHRRALATRIWWTRYWNRKRTETTA
jgi:ApeA N-terminal domain 1